MYIHGASQLHASQSLRGPHRGASTPEAAPTQPQDEVQISGESDALSKIRDIPDIRHDRVAEIRQRIASGEYETPEKLDIALERLLDEIG